MKKFTSIKSTWLLIFAFIFCFGTKAQVYTGSLTLSSQAEVNAFSYTEVTGTLRIEGSDISSLTPLLSLTSVGGGLYIESNLTLISLSGLGNLTSVGGDLFLIENPKLTSLSGLGNLNSVGGNIYFRGNDIFASLVGIENLTSVGGYLSIYNNDALTSLSGMENLTSVGGDLSIYDNAVLSSLSRLENLTSVGGYLSISSNPALTSLSGLDNLTSLGEGLWIEYNTLLTSLSGLGNITSVGQSLVIQYNDALSNLASLSSVTSVGWVLSIKNNTVLTSLAGLENITSVGWGLFIDDNAALTSLVGLENLTSIGKDLYIRNNFTLTSLAGLDNVTVVGWNLDISNNAALTSFCSLYELINGGGLTGTYNVYSNAVNPTKEEIIADCAYLFNSPPEAVCHNVTVSANENCQAMVTAAEVNNGSTDPDGDEISLSIYPEGPYSIGVTNVTLTVDDGVGGTATCEATITVEDDASPTLIVPANVTIECDMDNSPAITGMATATDNCSENITIAYSDIFVAGCGNTGVITRTWTATDECGNTASVDQTITIVDTSMPVITCPADLSIECSFDKTPASTGIATASDDCGDVLISFADEITDGCGCTEIIIRTWTATDDCGNLTSEVQTITVVDEILPEIQSITAPFDPISVNSPVEVTAIYFDDNLDFATWDWGDGNIEYESADGTVTRSHIYTEAGVFALTLTLEDLCGVEVSSTYQYIVIYDPNGGFVTGGGWIWSPPGAYVNDPLLEGKANFGFVSKYKKGASIPDGNTEFQFKAGNMNFKSTEYEWLVIAGSKAMFKGSGIINSTGNYGFMLSAVDADLTPSAVIDKFRIKIWDKVNDLIVYDNNLELEENAEPATEIGGGSIVIHKSKEKIAQIESDLIPKPENLNLSVYPNPFNDRLHFEFESQENVHILIEIYDLTGRKLETVFNQQIKGGEKYNVDFTPKSDETSMYLYQVKLGDKVYYNKVIRLKK